MDMYSLLADYVTSTRNLSNVDIRSYNTSGNICIYVYSYYSHSKEETIYNQKGEVNIWDLLILVASKLN